jgi:diaminopimelate epimerase
MRFWKAHGLGNDYLVLEDPLAPTLPLTASLVIALCDRHRGVGSDGILEPAPPELGADFGVRIWNPDGSTAEKSGNGLRIFARWLRDTGRARDARFSISTGPCRVECETTADAVSVEMGAATFKPAEVPALAPDELVDAAIDLSDGPLIATAVGMGNPHCVVFRDEPLDTLPWRRWGAELERHPRFPNRTNVQIARVIDRHAVEIRIHERGAGETQASGSSSCAAAAAGVRTGRLDAGRIRVEMPGGRLWVTVSPDGVLLEGPVEAVGHFEVDAGWLARHGSAVVSNR